MRTYHEYNRFGRNVLMLIVAVPFLFGCERRPLENEVSNIAMIPIEIDWSQSRLDIEAMHRATIRIFPQDGSPAYDFRLQENLTKVVMPLAVGKYSLVIFNETIDDEDWKSLIFSGVDTYDEFMVATREDAFRGLYSRADNEDIRKAPDALATWSIDNFEVTPDMVAYTKALAKGDASNAKLSSTTAQELAQQLQKISPITPVSVVKTLNITAHVQNLVGAQKASAAIKGATKSVHMSTRKPSKIQVTHIFIMNGRKYDDPTAPTHGSIGASILVFNLDNYNNFRCDLSIDFLLHDGGTPPAEIFDITKDITKNEVNININLGFVVEGDPDDHPIILPEVEIGGGSVDVDDWESVVVPIK